MCVCVCVCVCIIYIEACSQLCPAHKESKCFCTSSKASKEACSQLCPAHRESLSFCTSSKASKDACSQLCLSHKESECKRAGQRQGLFLFLIFCFAGPAAGQASGKTKTKRRARRCCQPDAQPPWCVNICTFVLVVKHVKKALPARRSAALVRK